METLQNQAMNRFSTEFIEMVIWQTLPNKMRTSVRMKAYDLMTDEMLALRNQIVNLTSAQLRDDFS